MTHRLLHGIVLPLSILICSVFVPRRVVAAGNADPAAKPMNPSAGATRDASSIAMVAAQDRHRILTAADAALQLKPFSITDHRSALSEGGPNDFFSMSDYFWPNPGTPDGKPYVRRDGESYPGNFNEHRLALMNMRDATSALAAAFQLTHDECYAAKAVELLRVFFVDPATRMNPALEHAQVMVGIPAPNRGIGLIDTLHLIETPMAILALEGSKSLTPELKSSLRQWFKDYLTWFTTSPRGKDEGSRTNNHAVAYWLQVAAFNQLAGDEALHAECLRHFKDAFVGVQMATDGSFPNELSRTKPYAYSIFQLDNMATLCLLLSKKEKDLWTYEGPEGRSMRKAMAYLFPYLADKSKWPLKPDAQAWDDWPIRQASLLFGGAALGEEKYLELWRTLKPDPALFEIRRNNAVTQPLLWMAGGSSGAPANDQPQPKETVDVPKRRLRAGDVFDLRQPTIFQDDFRSGALDRWSFSENDQYELPAASPDRIKIVDAPGLRDGSKAVRFVVQRAPNSFRSEISLPSEKGFQERWYAERILIPDEWVFDPARGNDIVMQWHAIPGNWRPTFPNLDISVGNDRWFIKQSFGSAQTNPTRTTLKLDDPVHRGAWVSWIIHAKWSPREDGVLQIWRDGKLVVDRNGPNVYGTIGIEYTPYLKTGIYHPEWHLTDRRKRTAFESEKPVATKKIVYVTDVKIGSAKATMESVNPPTAQH